MSKRNWRDGLRSYIVYKRRFALRPVDCNDGSRIWFKWYYKQFKIWHVDERIVPYRDEIFGHKDFIANISEAEYIVRKLAESL